MAEDDTRLTDPDTRVELNPDPAVDELAVRRNLPDLPARPADTAAKAVWVDYVVALGADRTFVSGDTEHFDPAAVPDDLDDGVLVDPGLTVVEPGLTVPQLRELATRLGG